MKTREYFSRMINDNSKYDLVDIMIKMDKEIEELKLELKKANGEALRIGEVVRAISK